MALKAVRLTVVGLTLLFNSFCSLTICNAELPWRKFSYFQNFGGLNDQLSGTEIEDNEATDLQNVVFDTGGAIKKRFGYLTWPNNPLSKVFGSGTDITVTGLGYYQQNDADKFVIAISNVDAAAKATYRDITNGIVYTGSWTDITGTGVLPTTGYTDNDLVDFAVAENIVVFTLDAATQIKPVKWNGAGNVATLTADADCPVAIIVEYHKNHLFLTGSDTNPSRVVYSALDDITAYTATDFFDVQTADGTRVRGLISAYDSLYIFKDRSIWRLSGAERDTFVLQKMVEGIGTLSNASIRIVNNLIYFTTAQNDIAVYDGAYTVKFLSQKIRQTIGGLNFSRATNALGLNFSTYKYQDEDYYCSVSDAGSATNSRILLFDTAYSAWTKFAGINVNAWCVAPDSNGQNILIFGDYNGYAYTYPSVNYYDGNVETEAIVAFYQTKWFKYSDVALGDKYWRVLKTYALSETTTDTLLYAECKADYEESGKIIEIELSESGSLWDVALWDVDEWSGQGLKIGRHEIEKGTNMFQIKYSNNIVNEGFTIFGFELFIEPSERI